MGHCSVQRRTHPNDLFFEGVACTNKFLARGACEHIVSAASKTCGKTHAHMKRSFSYLYAETVCLSRSTGSAGDHNGSDLRLSFRRESCRAVGADYFTAGPVLLSSTHTKIALRYTNMSSSCPLSGKSLVTKSRVLTERAVAHASHWNVNLGSAREKWGAGPR